MKEIWKEKMSRYLPRLASLPGEVSIYGKNLHTGEVWAYQPDIPLVAASVIKLPTLAEAFRQARDGQIDMKEIFAVRPDQKMPGCGALTRLRDGIEVTLHDLCVLMIILSDNTATNILIERLGMDQINQTIRSFGLEKTKLRRKLFDADASARGIENTMTAQEMGRLLEMLSSGSCVSPEADAEILSILSEQQLNGKIPFFLPEIRIAHKTGEDDGITHDVGILYAKHPVVLCFGSEHTDVPAFERCIQDMARDFMEAIA
ncbi:MAG: serine hydrolase [Clostridia bacterium]|nr:serine hydrolase [Clostridia bacterium]